MGCRVPSAGEEPGIALQYSVLFAEFSRSRFGRPDNPHQVVRNHVSVVWCAEQRAELRGRVEQEYRVRMVHDIATIVRGHAERRAQSLGQSAQLRFRARCAGESLAEGLQVGRIGRISGLM